MKSFKEFITEKLDVTNNPNFWKWFGDSDVVDEDGNPLLMFHGSGHDITKFVHSSRRVFYFTSCKNAAADYAERTTSDHQDYYDNQLKETIYPVFIKMENPFDPDDPTHRESIDMDDECDGTWQWMEHYAHVIRAAGYDGMLVLEVHDVNRVPGERPVYEDFDVAVFEPTQIKSATGNNGNFDPNDPDITH